MYIYICVYIYIYIYIYIYRQREREETIILVKEIEQNQLTRLPKIALQWMPKPKSTRRRPKKNWMEGI